MTSAKDTSVGAATGAKDYVKDTLVGVKDSTCDAASKAGEKVENARSSIAEKGHGTENISNIPHRPRTLFYSCTDAKEYIKESAKGAKDSLMGSTEEAKNKIKEKAEGAKETVKQSAEGAKESAKETGANVTEKSRGNVISIFLLDSSWTIFFRFLIEGLESMKESAEKPEGHHESKGILGTLRDMLTPESSETAKCKLRLILFFNTVQSQLDMIDSFLFLFPATEETKSNADIAKGTLTCDFFFVN